MVETIIIVGVLAYLIGAKKWTGLKIVAIALFLTALLNIQSIIMFIYVFHCMMFGHDCL